MRERKDLPEKGERGFDFVKAESSISVRLTMARTFRPMITGYVLGVLTVLTLCSCRSPGDPLEEARNAKIRREVRGAYYVGRRYWVKTSRVWGWVRKPRQPWDKARLVITNEGYKRNPDRLPEYRTADGLTNGYDHNYEYKLRGYFSGDEVYDPKMNLILPEFVLVDYELIDTSPGWLFSPSDEMGNDRLPRVHAMILVSEP